MSAGNTQSGNTGTSVTAQKIANTYNLADPNVGGSVKAKVTSIADGVVQGTVIRFAPHVYVVSGEQTPRRIESEQRHGMKSKHADHLR